MVVASFCRGCEEFQGAVRTLKGAGVLLLSPRGFAPPVNPPLVPAAGIEAALAVEVDVALDVKVDAALDVEDDAAPAMP